MGSKVSGEQKRRRLRVDIPKDLADILDQIKILEGKNKREVVEEALRDFLERR